MMAIQQELKTAQDIYHDADRIVVKIGTETIIKSGQVDFEFLNALAEDIREIFRKGKEIFIVTSGAIGLGRSELEIPPHIPTKELPMKIRQDASIVGQISLMAAYQQALARFDLRAGQILLAKDDFSNPERKSNFVNVSRNETFQSSKTGRIIRIYNEDDALVTKEIAFGDNDSLGAEIAVELGADAYIMLSDVYGLHKKDPKECGHGEVNPLVSHILDIESEFRHANGNTSPISAGGMKSKGTAARKTAEAGIYSIITKGKDNPHALRKLFNNSQPCTIIYPHQVDAPVWLQGHIACP